ncbi:RNA-binding protein [Streptomyces sp. NPDC046942]
MEAKGFGFVTMSTDEEAKAAIEHLHGSMYERRLTVADNAPPGAR